MRNAKKIYEQMCKVIKLSAKEKRLYKYILDYAENDNEERLTVGKICKDLHTTPSTLLKKTMPALIAKGLLPS